MSAPYREAPQFLLCPRCAEVLDRVFAGVTACPRCQGLWIGQGTLDTAFGNPRWPGGQNMWWHATLECPECASEGRATKMDARNANEVMVDLCPSHGLWLDQGELGRLMGIAEGADELLELQNRIAAIAPDGDDIAERRQAWRAELEQRRRVAQEFRAAIEAEQKKRVDEARDAERARAAALEAEREQRRQLAIEQQRQKAAWAREEHERELAVDALLERRMQVIVKLRDLGFERAAKREELDRLQAQITALEGEKREIDTQLDSGEPKPK